MSHPREASPVAASRESVAAVLAGFYVVQAGDSGAKIAVKHDLMITDLLAMNPKVQWAKLKVGQLVRIAK
jgi:LysM repeat protein